MDEQTVIELYAKYDNCRQVAEELGTNIEAVRRILIKHDIKRIGNRPKRKRKTEKRMPSHCRTKYCAAVVIMLREVLGMPTHDISETSEIPSSVVVNIFDRKRPDLKLARCQRVDNDTLAAIENEYLSGASCYSLADRHGVHYTTILKWMRERGYSPREAADNARRETGLKKFVERLEEQYGDKYEYIGGYTKQYDKVTLKCLDCGTVFDRCVSWKNAITCPTCAQLDVEKRRFEKRASRQRERELQRTSELAKIKVCEVCGSEFHSEYQSKRYCSKECKNKHKNHVRTARRRKFGTHSNHRSRARAYGVVYEPGITLKRVYEKFGGVCQLCGKPCDKNDNTWGLCGPMYPTIDHIVALSNGGGHTWDNVQLAHAICNSCKRDLEDGEEITKAVGEHAQDAECDRERHETGTVERACPCDSGHHRYGRRIAQHGTTCETVPRDDTRDCRVGG